MTRMCAIDDCGRKVFGHGWCQMHYARWRRTGDPNRVRRPGSTPGTPRPSVRGIANPAYAGDDVGYAGMHQRVRRVRGRASSYPCAHCGDAAQDWAYDHTDPAVRRGDNNGYDCPYSLDPARYQPLCRTCHKTFDDAPRKAVA